MKLKEELKEAMALGGFQLAKWQSNCPRLLEGEETVVKSTIGMSQEESTNVLGVGWDASTDDFTFTFDQKTAERQVKTPRELVSVQASLFDPLGYIAPFVLVGRRMLQKSMSQKSGWDSPLTGELRDNFQRWSSSIPLLSALRIPRWWNHSVVGKVVAVELHLFSDASVSGYAAVCYRRAIDENGGVCVSIVTSRCHVVPLDSSRASHHNSIPRLELVAAEKSVELRQFVEAALKTDFDRVVMWTDSECVLKQIFDSTTRFKAFFANRLSKIHAATSNEEWRYVDSKNNPADNASRGINANESAM